MERRIVVLAPRGRDGQVIAQVLADAGEGCTICVDLPALAAALDLGAAAAVITEEALAETDGEPLLGWLRAQPPWSDFPFVVLATRQSGRRSKLAAHRLAAIGNVVLLERPVNAETLASAAGSALRARLRQYQARDQVEQLARAEEKLRVALEAGRLGSWDLDLTTGTLFASATCKANFGRAPSDPFTYGDLVSAIHPDDRARQDAAVQQAVASGDGLDVEYRTIWPDGSVHWVYVRGRTVGGSGPATVRMTGVSLDISARKSAEEELHRLNETLELRIADRTAELQDANRRLLEQIAERERAEAALVQAQKMEAIGQLTGGIAHDFNNLLTAILGNVEMIARRASDERVQRMAGYAQDAVSRATKLTGQLLAFSRSQQLDLRPVAVDSLIDGMDDLLSRSLGHAVAVRTELRAGRTAAIADANQLELAILNLAINARDAMPDGGTLTIGTRVESASGRDLNPGQYLVISVADTGAGIAPVVLGKVFDPFFTTKAVGKGTGLGLSQVYGIARQSGGVARIRNGEHRGAVVEIWLPVATEMETERPAYGLIEDIPRGSGETILVVDDDPDVRRFIAQCLDDLDYVVVEADHGQAGLDRLGSNTPDLLIVDFAMPGVNGAEMAAQAKRQCPDLPIILVTGYADARAIENIRDTDLVLRKPFQLDELARAVRQSLDKVTVR